MTGERTTEETYVFDIGADVYCADGRCGKLAKVVVDPGTHRVTDLIVTKGFLQKEDRVLPVSVVAHSTPERIDLSIRSDELKNHPKYKEEEFRVPAPDWTHDRYEREQVFYWMLPYGLIEVEQPVIIPMIRQKVHHGIPSNREVIGRGTPVRNALDRLGVVDHLLVERDSGRITHLVIRKAPWLPVGYRIIPMDKVMEVDDEGIYVKLSGEELESLPSYTPRR